MTPAELVKARGKYTQEKYAAKLYVPVATLRNWEYGRRPIPPHIPTLIEAIKPKRWHVAYVTPALVFIPNRTFSCVEEAHTDPYGKYKRTDYPYQADEARQILFVFER